MLPEFDLYLPQSLQEALECLAEHGRGVSALAGGTNLVVDMRSGRHTPHTLVDISRLAELKEIYREDGHILAGSGTTIAELLANPEVAKAAPCLRAAAAVFASPLVRNRATLGGNLADGSPAADTAPSLLALDAEVKLASANSQRCIPLDEFFLHVRRTQLQPGEIITAVRWKAPEANTYTAFQKLGLRKADAISVVSVAVRVDTSADGIVQVARIALGSVAPTPLRAKAAETGLLGQALTPAAAHAAAELAAQAACPISDVRASGEYRRQMVFVLVRRLLQQIASQMQAKEV